MDKIHEAFEFLSNEAKDLFIPYEIQKIQHIPSPLEFLRKWVNPNVPVVIKGGASDWVALKKWDCDYLREKLKDRKVTVAVTPNGFADAIALNEKEKIEMFVVPEERTMSISDLFTKLQSGSEYSDESVGRSEGIFYLQKQDSNLTEEFPELVSDIDSELCWASDAFGSKPSAINLWIGDERSVTSLHKDPFENIYCVVNGWKDFVLLPPTDRPWLPYKYLPVAQYKETSPGKFTMETVPPEEGSPSLIPWIAIDPLNPNFEKYPEYKNAHPLHVRVEAGDLLYLPSLWFHHVRQSNKCIAVNFWYDMPMDIKFVYFQLLEHLAKSQT